MAQRVLLVDRSVAVVLVPVSEGQSSAGPRALLIVTPGWGTTSSMNETPVILRRGLCMPDMGSADRLGLVIPQFPAARDHCMLPQTWPPAVAAPRGTGGSPPSLCTYPTTEIVTDSQPAHASYHDQEEQE